MIALPFRETHTSESTPLLSRSSGLGHQYSPPPPPQPRRRFSGSGGAAPSNLDELLRRPLGSLLHLLNSNQAGGVDGGGGGGRANGGGPTAFELASAAPPPVTVTSLPAGASRRVWGFVGDRSAAICVARSWCVDAQTPGRPSRARNAALRKQGQDKTANR